MDNQIDPNDRGVAEAIKELQLQLEQLANSRQPFLGDWFGRNVVEYSFVDANTIQSSVDVELYHAVGDRLRIDQGSGYQYFWVVFVDETNNQLRIAGGDNYTFTSADLVTLEISKIGNVSDWPADDLFVYGGMALDFVQGATGSHTDGEADCFFRVEGGFVQVYYRTTDTVDWAGDAQGTNIFAGIPAPLQPSSGLGSDAIYFKLFETGLANDASTTDVGYAITVFYGVTGAYDWPAWIETRPTDYGSRKYGKQSVAHSSGSITIYFEYSWRLLS